jgi:N-alpha-acetyltransferase 15/16, NatA auxiliary subunit
MDSQNPTLHVQSYRFRDMFDPHPDGASPKFSEIIPTEIKTLFPEDTNLSDWNKDFLKRHNLSASHVQAGLRVRALIGNEANETNEKDLFATLSLDSVSMDIAAAGLDLLDAWGSSAETKDSYKKKAAERWGRASVFQAKHIDTE